MSKNNFIDMVIAEKSKKMIYTQENAELTREEVKELLNNKDFARQELKENNISTNSPEIKAKLKPFNN